MAIAIHLSKLQLASALAYAAIFPLTNLAGANLMLVGIIVTFPFLPLAWLGGMLFVYLFGSEQVYLLGASATVLAQVLLFMAVWSALRKNTSSAKNLTLHSSGSPSAPAEFKR